MAVVRGAGGGGSFKQVRSRKNSRQLDSTENISFEKLGALFVLRGKT